MGARLNSYNSDLTRTFLYAVTPDAPFDNVFNAVLEAQEAAISAIRPGIDTRQVHLLAENAIQMAGYGGAFTHGLGHGLGLEIHEDPYLSAQRPRQELDRDMVITIEPGIYLPGWGGVRIEDLILITDGGSEYLSQSPKPRLLPVS
jgi:Xaa-Pro aminopeptidase